MSRTVECSCGTTNWHGREYCHKCSGKLAESQKENN